MSDVNVLRGFLSGGKVLVEVGQELKDKLAMAAGLVGLESPDFPDTVNEFLLSRFLHGLDDKSAETQIRNDDCARVKCFLAASSHCPIHLIHFPRLGLCHHDEN